MENNEQNQNKPTVVPEEDSAGESLEAQTTQVGSSTDATSAPPSSDSEKKKPNKRRLVAGGFAARFNIYLLLFIFLIVVAGVVTGIAFLRNKKAAENSNTTIKTEPLSKEALDQLRQSDVKVGDPKQILSVESNAIFAGQVLIRGGLEVAGEIKAGSPINLPGLTVTGNTLLGQVQANQIQVGGNASIQGQLTVQNNLAVSGSGSFGGTLTAARLNIQDLQLNGDLQFTKHIDAGGGTPGKSDGPALGPGGTSSVSGTDTAGTVAINTGSSTAAGCFVTITFSQRFNGTPHVVVTPIGVAGGPVQYYLNRSTNNFSICTANAAPAGQSFAFDYIVID